jgi:hypothetical protein
LRSLRLVKYGHPLVGNYTDFSEEKDFFSINFRVILFL